jgi:hypothetical protein
MNACVTHKAITVNYFINKRATKTKCTTNVNPFAKRPGATHSRCAYARQVRVMTVAVCCMYVQ